MRKLLSITLLLCAVSGMAQVAPFTGDTSPLVWKDGSGRHATVAVLGAEATYGASLTVKTATAAGTGPYFSICGSATKTVKIQMFSVGGTVATAAVNGDVVLKKTSAATSGGTATALVRVPLDSNSAAATVGAPNFYTVLATAGTLVGVIDSQMGFFPVAPALNRPVAFDWRLRNDSETPVLRGTAQCLEASFGTTTTNAPTLLVAVVWTEK